MSFKQIDGQKQAKNILQAGLRKNRVSHAYLFVGPSGTGKVQMAIQLAKALFCTENKDDACDICIECRKLEHGNHPRLVVIEPDGASVKLEQIRQLQKQFSLKSDEHHQQVYIIKQADKMTHEAANSLLKFLEEPSHYGTAILITENGQAILPTIRSRTQIVSFIPLSSHQIESRLIEEGFPRMAAKTASHLVSGMEGARALLQLNGFAEWRNVVIQLAKECLNSSIANVSLTIQHKIIKAQLTEHIPEILDILLLWFKDMLRAQAGSPANELIFEDQADWMRQHAYLYKPSVIIDWMDKVLESKRQLRSHVSPQLVLEQMCIQIKGG